jgi:hypothetical protein
MYSNNDNEIGKSQLKNEGKKEKHFGISIYNEHEYKTV